MQYNKKLVSVLIVLGLTVASLPIFHVYNQDKELGTSITTIAGTDTIKDSRTTINDNFAALNTGKIEVGTTSISSITALQNLATIGTIISGVWNGSVINVLYGGTGRSNLTANAILLGNGTNGIATTSAGTDGQLLTYSSSSAPYWASPSVDTTIGYTWTGAHTFNGTTTISATSTIDTRYNIGAGFTHAQVYTASSTWTKPTGVTKIKVRLVGGGGNGNAACGGGFVGAGGGGGGYSEEIIDVSATTSVAVVVGAATASSSFGNYLEAGPGLVGGCADNVASGGNGGMGLGGDFNSAGFKGGTGVEPGVSYAAGIGGGTVLGYTYGRGGDGGTNGDAGSAGTSGVVIIEY